MIENCASGGHRLVPSFLEMTSMSSFSDAHECDEIPLIAANMHRMILPRQSQIWAVIRREHTKRKLYSQICAGMLGRLCFSGDVSDLDADKREIIRNRIQFYHRVSPVIDRGESEITQNGVLSYRSPKGWQAVRRRGTQAPELLLVVVHTFRECPEKITLRVGDKSSQYSVEDLFAAPEIKIDCCNGEIQLSGLREFDGAAVFIRKAGI